MKVEIIRCFESDGIPYGEYYVESGNRKEFVFQNGKDVKIITHFRGKKSKIVL